MQIANAQDGNLTISGFVPDNRTLTAFYYMLIRVVVSLAGPQIFKAGKCEAAFFALPLLALGVLVRFACAPAYLVRPCPVIVAHRVMVDSVLEAAHNRILDSLFWT